MQVLGSMCQHMDSMSNGIQNLQAYLISLKIQLKVGGFVTSCNPWRFSTPKRNRPKRKWLQRKDSCLFQDIHRTVDF